MIFVFVRLGVLTIGRLGEHMLEREHILERTYTIENATLGVMDNTSTAVEFEMFGVWGLGFALGVVRVCVLGFERFPVWSLQ